MKGVSLNTNDICLFLILDISLHEPPHVHCKLVFSPIPRMRLRPIHISFMSLHITHNPLCQGRANTQYSCHGVFINRSTFSLNLPRIQTPTRASVTNHKLGRKFKLASSSHQKIKKTNSHFVPFLYDLMQTGTEAQKKTGL